MKELRKFFLSLLLQSLILFIFASTTHAKSVIESCDSSDSCTSILSYRLPWESKLSEVAYRFQVNISDILGSNNIDSTIPWPGNQILPAKSLVKVPMLCRCVDGIRRSVSTIYSVRGSDTWKSIAVGYGGLFSLEQIRSVNGKRPLTSGERLVIPLPCTCFNNTDSGGGTAVFMSYVVQKGESLRNIGSEFGTTTFELETVNGLAHSQVVPGDVLAIPISACSSANLRWYNESLIVPNGSYTLTANNCIKCSCLQTDLSLQCSPSGIVPSCLHLQCKGSTLFIGDKCETQAAFGCSETACVYRGHSEHKIYSSLVSSSYIECSGNKSRGLVSPASSPSLQSCANPSVATNRPMVLDPSEPTSKNHTNSSRKRRMLSQASCFGLLLLEIALPFIF